MYERGRPLKLEKKRGIRKLPPLTNWDLAELQRRKVWSIVKMEKRNEKKGEAMVRT